MRSTVVLNLVRVAEHLLWCNSYALATEGIRVGTVGHARKHDQRPCICNLCRAVAPTKPEPTMGFGWERSCLTCTSRGSSWRKWLCTSSALSDIVAPIPLGKEVVSS